MFKQDWEKTSTLRPLPYHTVEKIIALAFPNKKLIACELLAGGCANLNYKIQFTEEQNPLILRIYLQNKHAVHRELKLATMLKPTIPIPRIYHVGQFEHSHFAISEFMPGITLRDLLLSNTPYDLGSLMYEVGVTLADVATYSFAKAGFFDDDLHIITHSADDLQVFVETCLESENVLNRLTSSEVSHIQKQFTQYQTLLPSNEAHNLVHGDFDPANLLVDHINNTWKVTGVLDWEFAFSGSSLWDIANMLRYAHQMPSEFQNAFLTGFQDKGAILPDHWQISIHLLNLSSLLDCLKRSDPTLSPNQCADIIRLIKHILSEIAHDK